MDARLLSKAIACPDCDLLQRMPPLPPGGKARCARCGCALAQKPSGPRDLPLALTVAAAIAFVIANASPLMDLSVVGRTASTTIVGGAFEMWMQGEQITAVLVAFCAVIAPAGYLLFMLTLLLAARRSPAPRWVGEMLRWAHHFETWSMLEVMMLGILVALIKIAELATVEAGHRHVRRRRAGAAVSGDHGHLRRARALADASSGPTAKRRAGRLRGSRRGTAEMTNAAATAAQAGLAVVRGLPTAVATGRPRPSRASVRAAAKRSNSAAQARSRSPGRSSSPRRSATSRPTLCRC